MKHYGLTDVGRKRLVNEDTFADRDLPGGCFTAVVCDGMGGAAGGGIASSIAKDVFLEELEKQLASYFAEDMADGMPAVIIPRLMCNATKAANTAIHDLSVSQNALSGMGTTIVAAVLYKNDAYIIHVGDSRAYCFYGKKSAQLTKDHSYVQEMVDSGRMTPSEAEKSSMKNVIVRAVGIEDSVLPDVTSFSFVNADYLLLCTDGLSGYLSEEEMQKIVRQPDEEIGFERKVRFMIELANKRGGADNITAYLIEFDKGGNG